MQTVRFLNTPCGYIGIAAQDDAVTQLFFGDKPLAEMHEGNSPVLTQAVGELEEYFAGRRRAFTFAMAPSGTPFQMAVWHALCEIPYGETRTYAQIAVQIGRPKACRAVGMANNRNPIAITIPCHRVIGANGHLTGYAAGTAIKERLLALEKQ